ncbi:MAG: hypothetical protein PHF05_09335 [Candidatus Izemoplasmatales bacterium]|nr:hypothetical protein [Candidatus Izemoplasmatales bacterium]
MLKKTIMFFITLLLIVLMSCDSSKTTYTFNINSDLSVESFDINNSHKILSTDEKVSIIYLTEQTLRINVYDIDSNELSNYYEIDATQTYVYDCDLSNDYLVCLSKNVSESTFQLIVYNLNNNNVSTEIIDGSDNLVGYDNSIEIEDEYVLINLSSGYMGKGKTYLVTIGSANTVENVYNYDISRTVMDGTLEEVFGGRNTIQNKKIVMSSIDFIDSFNYVSVYSIEDKSVEFDSSELFIENESCNILNADIYDDYVSLKTRCESTDRFYIFDISDIDDTYVIDFSYNIDNYKVKAIDEKYVIISDGNSNQDSAKLLFYDVENEILDEVDYPTVDVKYFGNTVYLYENILCILNSTENEEILVYDLNESEYIDLEYDFEVKEVYGIYNQFIIFNAIDNSVEKMIGYNMVTTEFQDIINISSDDYEISIFSEYIFLINSNGSISIIELEVSKSK